jgi:hypothetical protein
MSHPNNRENTNYPDDIQLKNEIEEISCRIKRIMETVEMHFPINGNQECVEKSEDADGHTENEPF